MDKLLCNKCILQQICKDLIFLKASVIIFKHNSKLNKVHVSQLKFLPFIYNFQVYSKIIQHICMLNISNTFYLRVSLNQTVFFNIYQKRNTRKVSSQNHSRFHSHSFEIELYSELVERNFNIINNCEYRV